MDNQKPNTTPDQQNTQPDQQNTQPDQQSAKTNQQPTTPPPSKAGAAGRPRRIARSSRAYKVNRTFTQSRNVRGSPSVIRKNAKLVKSYMEGTTPLQFLKCEAPKMLPPGLKEWAEQMNYSSPFVRNNNQKALFPQGQPQGQSQGQPQGQKALPPPADTTKGTVTDQQAVPANPQTIGGTLPADTGDSLTNVSPAHYIGTLQY